MAKKKTDKQTKLKTMIEKRGLTLKQLQTKVENVKKDGYTIGIDRLSRMSNIGKGMNITLQVLVRVAKALNCSLDDIVDDM
jgi:DNA-binding Xre family transcriptional regulator